MLPVGHSQLVIQALNGGSRTDALLINPESLILVRKYPSLVSSLLSAEQVRLG